MHTRGPLASCILLAALCTGLPASADQAVVPSSANETELSSGQEGPLGGQTNRRFLIVMDERALSGIPVGSRISGIRFRLDDASAGPWPPAGFSFTDYELRISRAATTAATTSSTFAANISGAQTLVMDGSLPVIANAYAGGPAPRPFGPVLNFDTTYVYQGGPLALDFNHTGTGLVTVFADASLTPATNFVNGVYSSASRTAPVGTVTSAPAIQFEFTPPTNIVVPPSLASTTSGNAQEGPIGGSGVRRFQFNINAATLNIPPGSVITGLAFRLATGANAWPPSNVTISDYEIRIGSGVPVASMSGTFASNISSPRLVRDGPLDLNTRIFAAAPGGPTPAPFGLYIPFSDPYPYFGGNLSVDINYAGTGLGSVEFIDATASGDFAATGMRGVYSNASRTALTGIVTNAPVTRFFASTGAAPDLAVGVTKVFVADGFANTEASAGLNTLVQSTGRTFQIVAAADQFNTIGVGSRFVGHAARADSTSPLWPGAAVNFASYEVSLSRSPTTPATISSTFADNVGPDSVLTRFGPLTIPMNAFKPLGTGPTAPFSFSLPYTSAYTYTGGPLSALIRHSGGGASPIILDSVPPGSPDYGVHVAARFGTDTELVGIAIPATVFRFDVDAAVSVPRGAPDTFNSSVASLLDVSDYTIQTIIAASELRDVPVGSVIDELWFRNYSGGARPASDAASADVEVFVATAARRPTEMSTTFADNQRPDVVQVHDGPLAIAAGTFPAGASNQYARALRFQRGFVYRGGDLCITIRHRGFTAECVNAAIPPSSARGRSVFADSFTAASGAVLGGLSAGYPAMRLGYTPSVCTPNALAAVEGVDGLSTLGTNSTIQIIVPASQLAAIDVGSAITGMSFRNSSSGGAGSFPTANFTFTRFDVRVAPTTVEPLAMSDTFASNVGAGEIVVREGPLFIPQNAFPGSDSPSTPGEFAWFVPFERAFIYNGGNLCITLRTQGTPPGNTTLDTDTIGPSARGAMRFTSGDPDALVALQTWGPLVTRFAFTARAFCPADFNNDGLVDDADFQIFVLAYDLLDCDDPNMPAGCPADLNYDRVVDDLDFQNFIIAYNDLLCP